MLQQLKPTDRAIEELALAETDLLRLRRFSPVRWGFVGNLALILFAGGLGLVHAFVAYCWRRAFVSTRDGTK